MDGAFDRDTGMAMLQTLCSSKKKVYVRCRGILMGVPTRSRFAAMMRESQTFIGTI